MPVARVVDLEWEPAAGRVDDRALAAMLGVPPSVPAELSGGRVRYLAPDGEGPADIAARATRRLLERNGLCAGDLDLIVFSTNTPDIVFPGSACLLQAELDCPTTPCLDVRAQCTGFIVALELARTFAACGTYRRILVAAAEVPSHQNRSDGVDPELACLCADSGAVALVEPGTGSGQVLACRQEIDGRRHREFWCELPACRMLRGPEIADRGRIDHRMYDARLIYPTIDLVRARETAVRNVPRIVDAALADASLDRADALLVAHVDPRVERELGELLAPRAARVLAGDHVYSYSASLPGALARARAAGAVAAGETVAMATAGQGASWGAAVVRL